MSFITDHLCVASFDEAYDDDVKTKVTHFLNVASEIMVSSRANHVYKKIGIADDDINSDIRSILTEAIEWIDKVMRDQGVVCVHCWEGKSRSVCVCIAYLCLKQNWSFLGALAHMKFVRPDIDIFPQYQQQLRMFILGY